VLTNPDMLHVGILPYHLQWADFLGGLRWVVVDEMHTYRGVFGSQVANVLRRLRRLCAHYGATPRFICTSATIANPVELAERLIEQPVTLIDDNGAPRGARQVILVNPPLLDAERGIRRSATLETADLAARCIDADLQTIVFGRARQTTELLLTYVRERAPGRRRTRSAATAAAICPPNAAPSKRGCAAAQCARWSPPMRWNWASTSASCRPR
jgi:DEAD/DEAH box helicase domain-containing protein